MGGQRLGSTDDPAIGVEQNCIGIGAAGIDAQSKRRLGHRFNA